MSQAGTFAPEPPPRSSAQPGAVFDRVFSFAGPPLLFGLCVWASVCLALYVAFWLELDNAYWAGATAAIVCQPSLGASLRKGVFRMVGTVIGAVAIVVLTALFPQDRAAFLVGLALWGAACGFVATVLRNFAAYAAALAGYTAAIIAIDELGATGGTNGEAFTFAVSRASEICIGIVCAGVVLAGTDFGGARRRLAAQIAALSAEITGQLVGAFRLSGPEQAQSREVRRDLIRRAIALDPVIDEAIGESSDLRYRSRVLQAATEGLFAALSGWRTVANHLELLPNDEGGQQAKIILRNIPQELGFAPRRRDPEIWTTQPSHLRRACLAAVRSLVALPARTPSLRLLADRTAEALLGISVALNGLTLLVENQTQAVRRDRIARLHVPDWLPPVVNAVRVFVTISAVELFWIVTGWPNGASAIIFAAIAVILFSPKADQAYAVTMSAVIGNILGAVLAAIVKFAVLPGTETFVGFSLAIALVLVPVGALVAQPWQTGIFVGATFNFIPFLAPANQMTYDTQQFYNSALAIIVGFGAGALAFRLMPPLSPAVRTRRLLNLTLRDLRRLATRPNLPSASDWEGRIYGRMAVLPEAAEPAQRAQLAAALSVGTDMIRLRRLARSFDLGAGLDAALEALAHGDSALATERLAQFDRTFAALPNDRPGATARLRARCSILAISEALHQYPSYFDAGTA